MLCKKPHRQGIVGFGCGQCNPCRFKKRREITHRGMLESLKHGDSAFITLTYRIGCYASTHEDSMSVFREHTQKWLKRLRKRISHSVRAFGVGEYGEDTRRPHYHVVLYGYPTCIYGRSRYSDKIKDCCHRCDLIRDTWQFGHVLLGDVTKDSIQYVAGYVTKKMTSSKTEFQKEFLNGRNPEFAIYPNKPGLGAVATPEIAALLATEAGSESIIKEGDIPLSLKHGGKHFPLGRYLRSKIRKHYGFPSRRTKATSVNETNTPEGWLQKAATQVYELLEKHNYDQKKIVEEKMQQLLNFESKRKILTKRRKF